MATEPSPNLFRSRFGGLWPDLANATTLIDGKRDSGHFTEEEAHSLRFWVEHGYWVISGAVDPGACDACLRDIDRVFSGELGPCFAEVFPGPQTIQRVRSEHRAMPHKLLDLYAVSEAARRVLFTKPIARFMRLLFERPILAFQSLSFEKGLGQPYHQDAAYVRVSSPLEFAASWVALEDIQEGSGELMYLDGSHRLPDHLFEGASKWMDWAAPEIAHADYMRYLKEESEKRDFEPKIFRPRKGDALIWAADLAHGGSPVRDQSLTRRSLVTHYCPIDVQPFYFMTGRHHGPVEHAPGLFYSWPIRA